MKKLLLKTTYPCLVKTDHMSCELDKNDTLEIEDEEFLFVYPQNGNIPFYIDIKAERENQFVSIIKHNGSTIFLLEQTSRVQIEQKEEFNFSGKTCKVFIGESRINFETANKKLTYSWNNKCNNYQTFKHKNYVCLQFEKDFFAYNVDKNKLSHFSGDQLAFENGVLTITKNFHDSMNREKHSVYNLNNETLLDEENFVSDRISSHEELLPFKVMESIQAKDYAFALSCLSEELKSQLDDTSLNDFFGNISSFLPLGTNDFLTLSPKGKNYVKFDISKDKIVDISIDAL